MPPLKENLQPLIKANLILLLFFLIFGGLYYGRVFFIPLAFAAIFAMLLTPLCAKLESWNIPRVFATFLCVLVLIFFILGLGALLTAQIASFSEDLSSIEQEINQSYNNLQQFLHKVFGISPEKQEQMVKQNSAGSSVAMIVAGVLGSITGILGHSLLALVYLFMLIYYRGRFAAFILMVVSEGEKEKAREVIHESAKVAQQYLVGRGLLILSLAVLYTIGLTLIGLDNAILFSLIAALFSIIPYLGNLIGVAFPLFMSVAQGGGSSVALGVIVVFAVVQFIESYALEPYIVGAEVDIHPFFTIAIIIIGQLVWGISGMILAIPILGIVKIIFSRIDSLEPYAFLIGGTGNGESIPFKNRVKGWFRKQKAP